jgi:hypothetical protein
LIKPMGYHGVAAFCHPLVHDYSGALLLIWHDSSYYFSFPLQHMQRLV